MKNMIAIIMILLVIAISVRCNAAPVITAQDGGYLITTPVYSATVMSDGGLSSIKAGNTEFLNATNNLKHAGYIFQNSNVTQMTVSQQGNIINAKSDKASVKYEFNDAGINISAANLTSDTSNYFMIFDLSVKAASNDGKFTKTPVTNDWHSVSFYKDTSKITASGATKLWGPWDAGHQVFDATLAANETREIKLEIAAANQNELKEMHDASVPEILVEKNITVLSPLNWQVFQRTSRYAGQILLSGRILPQYDSLMVRITGKSLKGKLDGDWKTVPTIQQTKTFLTKIPVVPGGWYTVELKAVKDGKTVAETKIEKVGVGEVFVGAGQSNSTNCGQEKTNETSGMVSSFSGEFWQLANDPQPGPHDKTMGGSFWPAFGDAMYAKYKVPIGVAVTGHGGTNVSQWQPEDPLGLFPWMMTRIYELGPMGFRAVLWHQGESDFNTPTETYVEKMSIVIRDSTKLAGWQFPWFIAHVSYINPQVLSGPLVRNAQDELIKKGIALDGPDTDLLTGDNRDYNGAGIHFSPKGLKAHGKMWAEKVGIYLDKVLGTEKNKSTE